MPKHYIRSASNRRAELHWQRGVGVQLATTVSDEPDLDDEDGGELGWSGEFVDFDRAQINHLIKQLRIARDQAYGRDE